MKRHTGRKTIFLFSFLILLLTILFVLDIITGSVPVSLRRALACLLAPVDASDEISIIIHHFRLPRALTALLAGSALAVSGLQMQTIFRNPLAGPYVLGISSGASLGVAILVLTASGFMLIPAGGVLSNWSIVAAAWMGSGLILLIILLVSLRINDIMTILILGILFGSITIAIVGVLQYFSNEVMLKTFVIWTLGSLGNVDTAQLQIMVICILTGLLLSLTGIKNLDAMLIGEDYARSLGVSILFTRIVVFLSTSFLAGTVTAFCGPVGFVGIIVPHFARLLFRTARHAVLLPGSLLVGSGTLLAADIISQVPGSDIMIPINSVTALLGIPVVIWIVLRNKKIQMV